MARRGEPKHVARRRSSDVLLVVDVLQPFADDEGRMLQAQLLPKLPTLARLLRAARRRKVPVLYVNDQHGPWPGDGHPLLRREWRGGRLARASLVETGVAGSRRARGRSRTPASAPGSCSLLPSGSRRSAGFGGAGRNGSDQDGMTSLRDFNALPAKAASRLGFQKSRMLLQVPSTPPRSI